MAHEDDPQATARAPFAALVGRAWPPDSGVPSSGEWGASLLTLLPSGVFVTDAAGRCVFTNPAFLETTGLDAESARGFGWTRAVHEDDQADLRAEWNAAVSAGATFHHEFRFRRANHPPVWVIAEAKPEYDPSGELAGYVGCVSDVSERHRIEREREALETRRRKSQRLDAVGTLAGGIAHDFNNLLTAIVTGVQLALDEPELDEGVRECLQAAYESAERAGELTRQLLTLGRQATVPPTPTDANERCRRARDLLRRSLPDAYAVELDLEEDLPAIAADPVALLQTILNLGLNAADAMPDGGRIRLSTRWAELIDEAGIGTPALSISVRDEGPGIPEADIDRIFDPFFTTKEQGTASGLGLAVVHGFAHTHGGAIDVSSPASGGARFTLTLPTRPDLELPPPRREGPLPCGVGKILLVDDDRLVLFSAREVLSRCGYEVFTARDGDEALEQHAEHIQSIDLVLTDLVMPRRGGRELVATLRERGCRAPALLMTGYAAPGLASLDAEGFVDTLLKPFSPVTLARAVEHGLEVARGRDD